MSGLLLYICVFIVFVFFEPWLEAATAVCRVFGVGVGVYVTAASYYEQMPQRQPILATLIPILVLLAIFLFSFLIGLLLCGIGGTVSTPHSSHTDLGNKS